jgi:hypothetical protein
LLIVHTRAFQGLGVDRNHGIQAVDVIALDAIYVVDHQFFAAELAAFKERLNVGNGGSGQQGVQFGMSLVAESIQGVLEGAEVAHDLGVVVRLKARIGQVMKKTFFAQKEGLL